MKASGAACTTRAPAPLFFYRDEAIYINYGSRMTAISLEFFPPKTEAQKAQFDRALPQLRSLAPEYASVTFGAGGSTLSYLSLIHI